MLGDKPLGAARFPPRDPRRCEAGCFATICSRRRRRRARCASPTSPTPAASTRAATAWASRPATSTTTAASTSTSPSFGPNQLFRNNCDGTFTDVSKASGTDDSGVERLGVVRRLRPRRLARPVRRQLSELQRRDATRRASAPSGGPTTARRTVYQPQPSRLYHNNRRRHVRRRHRQAPASRASSARRSASSTADFNGDGWIDIYVANDGQPNQLWINQRNGTFKNTALLSGAALSADGKAEAEHGRRRRRLRQRRRRRSVRHRLTGRGQRPVRQRRLRAVRGAERALGPRRRQPAVHRLRHRLVRLRQRRLAGHPDRQRRGADHRGAAPGQRSVSAAPAEAAVPQSRRRRGSRTSPRRAGAAFELSEVGRGAAFGDIDNDGDVDVRGRQQQRPRRGC